MTTNKYREGISHCRKCGREITFRDWNPDTEPMHYAERRWARAVLRHGWQYHREDFPEDFRTFTEFMEWYYTPEGREWDAKQGMIIEAERIVRGESDE